MQLRYKWSEQGREREWTECQELKRCNVIIIINASTTQPRKKIWIFIFNVFIKRAQQNQETKRNSEQRKKRHNFAAADDQPVHHVIFIVGFFIGVFSAWQIVCEHMIARRLCQRMSRVECVWVILYMNRPPRKYAYLWWRHWKARDLWG